MTITNCLSSELPLTPVGERFAAVLQEVVGCRFCGSPIPVSAAPLGARDRDCGNDPLAGEPFVLIRLDGGCIGVLVSVPEGDAYPPSLFGVQHNSPPEALRRLIRAALCLFQQQETNDRQQQELTACLEQMTYDMEEQTWLRMLTSQVHFDVRLSVQEVADSLLPSLREVVAAESVALLLRHPNDSPRTGRAAVWAGSLLTDDQAVRNWLAGQAGFHPPWIANRRQLSGTLASLGIRSIAAAPVGSDSDTRGWLIALNRVPEKPSALCAPGELARGTSEAEFGTVEAGLVFGAARMMSSHAENSDLLKDREELVIGIVHSMSSAIDARDPYTRGHSERVARCARRIAAHLELSRYFCDRIYLSGLLHDVGKIGVRDDVLLKAGRLTDEEFAEIRKHPEIGVAIVQNLVQLDDVIPGVLHHHEAVDGSGYPHGLAGDQIPLMARILAVADAYDAMTSDRPYRAGMPHERAVAILTERAGVQWDREVVAAFLNVPEHGLRADLEGGGCAGWQTEVDVLRRAVNLRQTALADC